MGGYRSGRRKRHHSTAECLPIDLTYLLKKGYLTSKKSEVGAAAKFICQSKTVKEKVTETQHSFYLLVKRYASGESDTWASEGKLTVLCNATIGSEDKGRQCIDVPLVTTRPNYGGIRWWMLAPCCGKRVRVLYLPVYSGRPNAHIMPACRDCNQLNYSSQQQSYIERHKTYEKHLLRNFGYTWAEWEYDSLKDHYFKVTPEWQEIKQRSILEHHLKLVRHLIAFEGAMLRTYVRQLRSLKTEEDQAIYLAQVEKEHGPSYVLDLMRMVGITVTTSGDTDTMSDADFEQAYMAEVEREEVRALAPSLDISDDRTTHLEMLIAHKRQVEEDIQALNAA